MKRVLFAASMVAIVAVAAWAYHINYRTKNALAEIDALRGEIGAKREALQVMRVEWAHLNRPERLSALVERYREKLHLTPIGPDRFGDVAAVPYPKPEMVDPLEAALAAAVASGAFLRPGDAPAASSDFLSGFVPAGAGGTDSPVLYRVRLGSGAGGQAGMAMAEVRDGATLFRLEAAAPARDGVDGAPVGPDAMGPFNVFVPSPEGEPGDGADNIPILDLGVDLGVKALPADDAATPADAAAAAGGPLSPAPRPKPGGLG